MKPKTLSLVTGASRGIGFAIAHELAAAGSDLMIVARDSQTLQEVANKMSTASGVSVSTFACDFSLVDAPKLLTEHCAATNQIPSLLVLNAGIFLEGALTGQSDSAYRQTMDVNLNAIVDLVRRLVPLMKHRSHPRIVLIGSTAAYEPYPLGPLYGVSKWALRGYAVNLRKELMREGIGVTFVAPGGTLTDLWAGEELSLGRLLEPRDVGVLIATLLKLSDQAVVEEIIVRPMLGDIHE